MQTLSNTSLKSYNSFGIDVRARRLHSVSNIEDLKKVLKNTYAEELFILGGGSNMLLTKDLDKTVVHINLLGKKVLREEENDVYVEACAGENWHQFVLWCLERGFGGLENLSLIPGNVGTSPIQNIGAYGVELKDHFHSCEALHVQTLESRTFSLLDCQLGYRDSVFKKELKGVYIITKVVFKLTRENHQLNTTYGAIAQFIEEKEITEPGIKDVSDAVIAIRQSKLPDPRQLGNSGSFFKNPVISVSSYRELQVRYEGIPGYVISESQIKVPAGWLIEKAGFKGFRKGDAGVHSKQALVLVNYGNASGLEILELSRQIQDKVYDLFDIMLQPEVNIIS